MLLFGKELLYSGKIYDFEDRINKLNAVTLDDVFAAVDRNFDDKFKYFEIFYLTVLRTYDFTLGNNIPQRNFASSKKIF